MNLNPVLILWSLGVLQPATKQNIIHHIRVTFPDATEEIKLSQIDRFLVSMEKSRTITRVWDSPYCYSLNQDANFLFSARIRNLRDSARIILLRNAEKGKFKYPGVLPLGQDGDAPSTRNGNPLEDARPKLLTVSPHGQKFWPYISSFLPTSDLDDLVRAPGLDLPLPYYSFPNLEQLANAADEPPLGAITPLQISLAIGLSNKLLHYFIRRRRRHYRSFSILKKDGGTREIDAPRLYLKTVQRWLADYIFYPTLRSHPSCHSYKSDYSFITNAIPHCGKKYIVNIDIINFFGSITTKGVNEILLGTGFSERTARFLGELTTYKNRLPQGAPTSPILSNFYLSDLDTEIDEIARSAGCVFTRYSDDLTISGNSKESLTSILKIIEKKLREKKLRINNDKLRIVSSSARQMVTGVVVNNQPIPPRQVRRKIRAMFHNATQNPEIYKKKFGELQGYISYLNAFKSMNESKDVKNYKEVIEKLNV